MNTAVAAFANAPAAACPAVDWAEMVSHRDALVRFAQRRLIERDTPLALVPRRARRP